MITITTNAGQVAGRLRTINIKNATFTSLKKISKEGELIAKQMAPQKTGALQMGITSIANKEQAKIISAVPSLFPYHFWINQQPGYETIIPKFPYFYPKQPPIMYGQSGVKGGKGVNDVVWTGLPKYFTRTFTIVESMFFRDVKENVKKELQGMSAK